MSQKYLQRGLQFEDMMLMMTYHDVLFHSVLTEIKNCTIPVAVLFKEGHS